MTFCYKPNSKWHTHTSFCRHPTFYTSALSYSSFVFLQSFHVNPQIFRGVMHKKRVVEVSLGRRICIVLQPLLLDSATYTLNGDNAPEGGFEMSTITHSIILPCALWSVNAYLGTSANCISKTSNWTLAISTLERKFWSNFYSTFTLGLTTSTLKCEFHDFGIYLSLSDLSQAFRQIFVTISMTSVEM